jgi:methanethiol S-methyltransferase
MPDMLIKPIAIICYVLALAGGAAFAILVVSLGSGWVWRPLLLAQPGPWVVDLGWLVVFALQHSGMARESFKRRWTRFVHVRLERSIYTAVSGAVCLGIALTWQRIDGPIWWDLPKPILVMPLLAALGMVLINARFDHAGLLGLRQAWAGDQLQPPETLVVVGPYRFIRHPLMACVLVFLWAQPLMTPTLAALSGGLTVYIVVGIILEERDLLRRFDPDYATYRRLVPALIPWRRPLPLQTKP